MYKLRNYVVGDLCDGEYIDLAVYLLHEPQLYDNANKELLAQDIAHVIISPKSCSVCERWGEHLNDRGVCESCEEEATDDDR